MFSVKQYFIIYPTGYQFRPSDRHYIQFKTGYTQCTLISRSMGCHDIYSSVKIVLQPWVILLEI
jgi:hypothetical protein